MNTLFHTYLIAHHLHKSFCFSDFLAKLNHIQDDSLHVYVTHFLLAHVNPGFCSGKHPIVAVVSAEVWEEDGSFLRHHSEYTVFVRVYRGRFKADHDVTI